MLSVYLVGGAAIAAILLADVWLHVDYELGANLSLLVITVLVTVFTVLYGVRSNWRANKIGRAFYVKCVFLSLVLWQAVVSVWVGSDYPYRHVIRFVIYAAGAVAYTPMVVWLWRQQNKDREEAVVE